MQSDGKILAAGWFGEAGGFGCTSLARFNSSNSLDAAFNPLVTKLDGSVSELDRVVPLSGGQIMIAGHFRKINNTDSTQVARLNANGSLDPDFSSKITITDGDNIIPYSVAPVSGGKYVVSGYVTDQSLSRGFLCRLDRRRRLDPAFGPSGPAPNPSPNVVIPAGQVNDMRVQPDGRIVIVGNFSEIIDNTTPFWSCPCGRASPALPPPASWITPSPPTAALTTWSNVWPSSPTASSSSAAILKIITNWCILTPITPCVSPGCLATATSTPI